MLRPFSPDVYFRPQQSWDRVDVERSEPEEILLRALHGGLRGAGLDPEVECNLHPNPRPLLRQNTGFFHSGTQEVPHTIYFLLAWHPVTRARSKWRRRRRMYWVPHQKSKSCSVQPQCKPVVRECLNWAAPSFHQYSLVVLGNSQYNR